MAYKGFLKLAIAWFIFALFLGLFFATHADAAELPPNIQPMAPIELSDERAFISMMLPGALKYQATDGIVVSLNLGQSFLETGAGEHLCGGNNYYGMTYTKDGVAYYKKYASMEESMADYIRNLNRPLYDRVRETGNYRDACFAVKACGYASDPYYAEKVINIIEIYELWRYDIWPSTNRSEELREPEGEILTPCRPGDCGAAVEAMQGALDRLGYNIGPCGVDGVYGRSTRKAVEAFQKEHGLSADGVAGPQTIAAMELEV